MNSRSFNVLAGIGERLFFHVLEGPKTYEVSAEAGNPAIFRFQSSHVYVVIIVAKSMSGDLG